MSTPSETSIANGALAMLGERRISSIDEPSKRARTIRERYAELRDDLLQQHSWNFATSRASLAADAADPLWGFDHQYTLPSDFLALRRVNDPDNRGWNREGSKIVTDIDPPLEIVYTKRITTVGTMDPQFRQTLSALIAFELAEALTGDPGKSRAMEQVYLAKRRAARASDGQEPSPRRLDVSEWIDAREETGSGWGWSD